MARRRKGAKVKTARATEKVNILPEESTSGSGSTEDTPEEPPIVLHKKFGEIRVQHDDSTSVVVPPLENIRVPVIVNGCLPPKKDTLRLDRSIVFPAENDLPLDGSVIIKPGCFGPEKPPIFFHPIPESPYYDNIIREMEVLEPRCNADDNSGAIEPSVQDEVDMPVAAAPLPAIIASSDEVLPLPKSLSSLSIANEDAIGSSPAVSSVDSEEMCESPIPSEPKKPDDDSLLVPPGIHAIRRSNRIRTIGILKQKVRSQTNSPDPEKPVKVKSRWRRSSELEMHTGPEVMTPPQPVTPKEPESLDQMEERLAREQREVAEGLSLFLPIRDNEYKSARRIGKGTKAMTCDCGLNKDDIEEGEMGCGDDCLNRLMCLECGDNCALGERCSNKNFQKWNYSPCTLFKTEKKGFGLKALETIPSDTFIMEYVGEVVNHNEFSKRKNQYAKENVKHFYFMALKGDTIIDATKRGNISRYINHSCDPNAETQMWIVNGESRIGFYSKRTIQANEEITFDYKFQRYGRTSQECFCEAANCLKWIGGNPEDDSDEESDDDEEEEEDEDEDGDGGAEEAEGSPKKDKFMVGSSDGEKSDSDMELDSGTESQLEIEKPKVKKKRGRKPKPFSERKAERRRRRWLREKEPVQDIGLEDEVQRLTITGVKNCAHTLMLCRLMVRAEDWPTRLRLLQLISKADSPCRKLFLDYRGLMFIHDWMLSADLWSQRLEILKMLQILPISNRRMLIDSKLLSLIEKWAKRKGALTSLPPTADSPASDDPKAAPDGATPMQVSDSDSPAPDSTPSQMQNSDLTEETVIQEARTLMVALLESWSTIKEEFRIPKKERVQQMKVHQREADLEYHRSTPFGEKLDELSKIKLVKSNESREKGKEKDSSKKGGERSRGQESPSTTYPDWFRNHRGRKMTQERRQMYALKVLREEEASRHRMQQEELWNQHQARCQGLGLDPNVHPAMDPISGCPIFFDHATRTWSQTPPYQKYQYAQQYAAAYPGMMPTASSAPIMSSAGTALPYPMVSYVSTPGPYPMYPNMLPHMPQNNVITLPSVPGASPPQPAPHQTIEQPADAPSLTAVPANTPMKLPPKWKAVKDPRDLVSYYHIMGRKRQWEPPSWPEDLPMSEAQRVLGVEAPLESSSESSDWESDEEEGDPTDSSETTILETEVKETDESVAVVAEEAADTTQPEGDSPGERVVGDEAEADEAISVTKDKEAMEVSVERVEDTESPVEQPSQSDAMQTEPGVPSEGITALVDVPSVRPAAKPTKRREGLVQERLISPRYEPANRIEMKKYKETKLKLKKRREEKRAALKLKKKRDKRKERRVTSAAAESSTDKKVKDSSADKKIKESFKSSIVSDIVHSLNPYRQHDCQSGRISSSKEFKELARKLTNYVMIKELSHCQSAQNLRYNDSVKMKAREFVKKYMAKFGPEYAGRA